MEKKICCIGSNLESRECLSYLVEQGCTIHTLITLPSGQSKNVSDYFDLHAFCEKHGINVVDTTNVNSSETVRELQKIAPDYLFTLGWSQIFREDFIGCFSEFVVGTHPSKLPHGRGRAPLPWTILEICDHRPSAFLKSIPASTPEKLFFSGSSTSRPEPTSRTSTPRSRRNWDSASTKSTNPSNATKTSNFRPKKKTTSPSEENELPPTAFSISTILWNMLKSSSGPFPNPIPVPTAITGIKKLPFGKSNLTMTRDTPEP